MRDLTLNWLGDAGGDLVVAGNDLVMGEDLRGNVLISLFCDARATGDETEVTPGDPLGGWWPDSYGANGDSTGSLLWLLRRAKQTPDVLARARAYARAALRWLVDDGIAERVDVTASYTQAQHLRLEIAIARRGSQGGERLVYELRPDGHVVAPTAPEGKAGEIKGALTAVPFDGAPTVPVPPGVPGEVLGVCDAAQDLPGRISLAASIYIWNTSDLTLEVQITRSVGTAGAASASLAVTGIALGIVPSLVTWADGEGGTKAVLLTLAEAVLEDTTAQLTIVTTTGASKGNPATATLDIRSSFVGCGLAIEYTGGQTFPTVIDVELGSATGWVDLAFKTSLAPDRFVIEHAGATVLDTGYVGNNTAGNVNILAAELAAFGLAPEPIRHYDPAHDGFDLAGAGTMYQSFYKAHAASKARLRVYGPGVGTLWACSLSCPDNTPAVELVAHSPIEHLASAERVVIVPALAMPGDLLVAWVGAYRPPLMPPPGWTLIEEAISPPGGSSGENFSHTAVFSRIAGQADAGSSTTWTIEQQMTFSVQIQCYRRQGGASIKAVSTRLGVTTASTKLWADITPPGRRQLVAVGVSTLFASTATVTTSVVSGPWQLDAQLTSLASASAGLRFSLAIVAGGGPERPVTGRFLRNSISTLDSQSAISIAIG